jgi:integrase
MNHKIKVTVRRFRNRNGAFSFRVEATLNGVRIRRNFKTPEDAAAEKAALEVRALQMSSSLRTVATFLTEAQVREAEAAFRGLEGHPRPLAFYLEFALATYREPEREKPLDEAVAAYLEAKAAEQGKGLLSAPQLTTIRRQLKVLKSHFPGVSVTALKPRDLTAFFQHGNGSPKTYNNRRGIASTFLKFALREGWIAEDPILKVQHHRVGHCRGSAETLSAAQARELMAHVEGYRNGCLVPYFALCLFAGIRPCLRTGEILKLRPEHVRLDTGVIHIEPEVSKVRMKRNVTIQANLAAWLQAYPLERFPIIVPALQKHRARIAKLFGFSHDVMRHTFISFFIAKYRSMGEAALQAGNSESIIRRHYLDLKNLAEAEDFFNILPKKAINPGVEMVSAAPPTEQSETIVVQSHGPQAA